MQILETDQTHHVQPKQLSTRFAVFATDDGLLNQRNFSSPTMGKIEIAVFLPIGFKICKPTNAIMVFGEFIRMLPEVLIEGFSIKAAHFESQAGCALRNAHRATGLSCNIRLACTIDRHFCQHCSAANLRFQKQALHGFSFQNRACGQHMGINPDASFLQHFNQYNLKLLFINDQLCLRFVPIANASADGHQAFDDPTGYAAEKLFKVCADMVIQQIWNNIAGQHAT